MYRPSAEIAGSVEGNPATRDELGIQVDTRLVTPGVSGPGGSRAAADVSGPILGLIRSARAAIAVAPAGSLEGTAARIGAGGPGSAPEEPPGSAASSTVRTAASAPGRPGRDGFIRER